MKYGKSFGAAKTTVIRMIRRGYSPERTQISVYKSDRTRLRKFCSDNGGISMIDGISRLLDAANVRRVQGGERSGEMQSLIHAIRYKAKEFNPESLIARIKSGEFDDFIFEQTKNK